MAETSFIGSKLVVFIMLKCKDVFVKILWLLVDRVERRRRFKLS